MSLPERRSQMSSPPKKSKPKPDVESGVAAAAANVESALSSGRVPLAKRLPDMTDYQLLAYQTSAVRISRDTTHPKSASAKVALPMIEKEISRRATSPDTVPSKGREPIASPKQGKKRADD